MENILIVADMEGSIGLYETKNLKECLSLMQKEVKCVIDYLVSAGNYTISVLDCHNNGENLTPLQEEYKQVKFIKHVWSFDRKIKYDFAIFTGFHAKMGPDGFCPHTFREDIAYIKIGEKIVGELEILINWLEYYGTPTIFVSGDTAAIAEVSHLNCLTYSTKTIGFFDKDFDFRYSELILKLSEALNLKKKNTSYNNEKVELKFFNDDFLDYLPEYDYKKRDNTLSFKDTIHLLESLYEMSFIINAVCSILFIKVSRIFNELRKSYTFEDLINMNDPKINGILNMQNKQCINKEQRAYLVKKFSLKDI